jgi:hypothetical protein
VIARVHVGSTLFDEIPHRGHEPRRMVAVIVKAKPSPKPDPEAARSGVSAGPPTGTLLLNALAGIDEKAARARPNEETNHALFLACHLVDARHSRAIRTA